MEGEEGALRGTEWKMELFRERLSVFVNDSRKRAKNENHELAESTKVDRAGVLGTEEAAAMTSVRIGAGR